MFYERRNLGFRRTEHATLKNSMRWSLRPIVLPVTLTLAAIKQDDKTAELC